MSQTPTQAAQASEQKALTWEQAWEEVQKLKKYREDHWVDLLTSEIQAREEAVQQRLPACWFLHYWHEREQYMLLPAVEPAKPAVAEKQ